MAAKQDALRRNIARKRVEISDDVDRLEVRLHERYEEARDWRRIVQARPLAIAGAVLAVAFLLGLRFGSRDD